MCHMQTLLAAAWPEHLVAHPRTASVTTCALLQDALHLSEQAKSSAAGARFM